MIAFDDSKKPTRLFSGIEVLSTAWAVAAITIPLYTLRQVFFKMTPTAIILTGANKDLRDKLIAYISQSKNFTEVFSKLEELEKELESEKKKKLTISTNDPDIHIITPEKEKKEKITIDQIRKLKEVLSASPKNHDAHLIIFEDAEKLTIEAQNAFLKTLEEPSSPSFFIFETDFPSLLLETIHSRTVEVALKSRENEQKEQDTLDLNQLKSLTLAKKFSLAQKKGINKQVAIDFLNSLKRSIHLELKSNLASPISTEKVEETKSKINSNTNSRLALENLFLDW